MSWLSGLFNKNKFKTILKLGEMLLRVFLGGMAKRLQEVAFEEVLAVEGTGKSGSEKVKVVFGKLKDRFPELRDYAINLAIELAVTALKNRI